MSFIASTVLSAPPLPSVTNDIYAELDAQLGVPKPEEELRVTYSSIPFHLGIKSSNVNQTMDKSRSCAKRKAATSSFGMLKSKKRAIVTQKPKHEYQSTFEQTTLADPACNVITPTSFFNRALGLDNKITGNQQVDQLLSFREKKLVVDSSPNPVTPTKNLRLPNRPPRRPTAMRILRGPLSSASPPTSPSWNVQKRRRVDISSKGFSLP